MNFPEGITVMMCMKMAPATEEKHALYLGTNIRLNLTYKKSILQNKLHMSSKVH